MVTDLVVIKLICQSKWAQNMEAFLTLELRYCDSVCKIVYGA
jgi:hypothetical protein